MRHLNYLMHDNKNCRAINCLLAQNALFILRNIFFSSLSPLFSIIFMDGMKIEFWKNDVDNPKRSNEDSRKDNFPQFFPSSSRAKKKIK